MTNIDLSLKSCISTSMRSYKLIFEILLAYVVYLTQLNFGAFRLSVSKVIPVYRNVRKCSQMFALCFTKG